MIAYLDTSAVIPLVVEEPSSVSCRELWELADDVAATRLLYVEAAAALDQARRQHRLTRVQHQTTVEALDQVWEEVEVIELDETLMRRAAACAQTFGLRGYDAVHCAAAEAIAEPDLVAASGDARLLAAWRGCGVSTFDTNAGR